ncbi:MAG: 2-oxoacid:acceptor oxidoreductase family protein [Candidatus Odinarchaeota archaeon]
MREPFNILVAGVGGQGNLVCGRVLAEAAIQQGLRPVVGDTFGASRRGGSVLTHLRLGTRDWAPLIPQGEVDILLGLEPMEALRAAVEYAGKRTIALVSLTEVPTANVNSGERVYPPLTKVSASLAEHCKQVYMLDAESALLRAGSPRALNSFLLGSLSALTENPLSQDLIRKALYTILGRDTINVTAFEEGVAALHQ